jgi:hypothetical protein
MNDICGVSGLERVAENSILLPLSSGGGDRGSERIWVGGTECRPEQARFWIIFNRDLPSVSRLIISVGRGRDAEAFAFPGS